MEQNKPKTINEKELEILDFWDKDKTFEKSLEKTKNGEPYIFYDGPPFATGLPHYGHLLGSITKDVYGRFWTMKGNFVRRVWGWDCHGLPIENIAEKGLGINSKDEIEKMGIKKFNEYCRNKVLGYSSDWERVIKRIGRWVDMKNCYKTMDNDYIESVWWAFKQLYEKGYIYEGEKILMYCPRCSTPLAKSEIAMDNSYKVVKDETVVVKFKLKNKKAFALAWTTTPWTLPSNLALAVHPKLIYVYLKDKSDGVIYLLAKSLISKFFKSEEEYEIKEEVYGEDLENLEYEPIFPYFKDTSNSFKIILGDFVTAEEGTGIVHTAPAFGEEDYNICRKYNIPMIQPVDTRGSFTKEVADFAGKYVHDTNTDILIFLKKQGKIVSIKKMDHEYPFCYRCDTKLMYRAIPAWFVDVQKIKPRLLELNKRLNWYPGFLKDGRAKYTIETAPDWNISRNRYWATAIPIWKSEDGELLVIGSVEELKKYAKNLPKGRLDLHKDFLDEVVLVKDKKEFKRIPEVLDCWFESGAMTFAQFHYPFENKVFFEKNFPAQFVVEYLGQVRAWFYYMNVLSAIIFDEIPFENIITTGTILAEDGEKMSKSKNNFTDPMILIGKFGIDSLRFYLMGNSVMNADNLNFSEKGVEEIYKKVLVLLHNVINFNTIYKEIPIKNGPSSKNIMDKWILSKTNGLIKQVQENYSEYNTILACDKIKTFIEDLSTWYIRRSRDRFNEQDVDAKTTLVSVIESIAKVIAPIMPFSAEMIFRSIGNEESVHLSKWPTYEEKRIDKKLEKEMQLARDIVSLVLKERDLAQLPLKQPLPELKINSPKLGKKYIDIISEETNIKKVLLINSKDLSIELSKKITPELEDEGIARELIRTIQSMRKKNNLVKSDRIVLNIYLESNRSKKIFKFIEKEKQRIGADKIFFNIKDKIEFLEEGNIRGNLFGVSFFKL